LNSLVNLRLERLSIQTDSIGASIPRFQVSVEAGQVHTLFAALAHPGPSLIDVAIGAPLQWHPVATVRGARLGVI